MKFPEQPTLRPGIDLAQLRSAATDVASQPIVRGPRITPKARMLLHRGRFLRARRAGPEAVEETIALCAAELGLTPEGYVKAFENFLAALLPPQHQDGSHGLHLVFSREG